MKIMTYMSDIILPLIIFFVVGYGLASKVKVYEAFLKGAGEGLRVVVDGEEQLGALVALSPNPVSDGGSYQALAGVG